MEANPLSPKLRVSDHKKARELAKLFLDLSEHEAWVRLTKFCRIQVLLAGQDALANPSLAQRKADWASGVSFILDVVQGTIDQVEVVDEDEPDEIEDEFLALTIGQGEL